MSNDTTSITRFIDHSLLKSETTADHIKQVRADAKQYSFAAACINLNLVGLAEGMGTGFAKTRAGFNGGA